MNYEGKLALVLGLGESGLAMAQWLGQCGARVRVADTRTEPQRLPALREAAPDAEFVHGEFAAALVLALAGGWSWQRAKRSVAVSG